MMGRKGSRHGAYEDTVVTFTWRDWRKWRKLKSWCLITRPRFEPDIQVVSVPATPVRLLVV